ncbi:MAG: AtpZ/AtpI family protein [Gemmatimonadota bacterium]
MNLPGPRRGGGPNPLRFVGLGVQLAVTVIAGVYGGQWLDRKVGTVGIFAALGGLLGFALTLWSLLRTLDQGKR